MRKVKIITDSCSDIGGHLLEKYNIDYAKMFTVEDGNEAPAILTWSSEEVHEFYEKLRAGKRITTTQVPIEEFRRIFVKYAEEGYDIVYIGCSSKQSGSVNTGFVTSKKIMKEYPDCKIICIDSQNASAGIALLSVEAAKLAEQGKSAEEIEKAIVEIRKNVNQYVTVHSLDALRRAGRVSASSAFLGNLMGVKPILISDANGTQVACKKVKGRQKSLDELVAMLKESIIDPENQTLFVAHSDCAIEEVEAVAAKLRAEIPCNGVEIGYIGPIIGASIGPDAIGVWGVGKKVTFTAEN